MVITSRSLIEADMFTSEKKGIFFMRLQTPPPFLPFGQSFR